MNTITHVSPRPDAPALSRRLPPNRRADVRKLKRQRHPTHAGGVGMGWVRVRSPPVLQSKLLCLSLLYLLTTLPLALYVSFSDPDSSSRCLLLLPSRSSSAAAATTLFEYPGGYGEHKHALPTPRALCSYPAVFSGLSVQELHRRETFAVQLCFLLSFMFVSSDWIGAAV